jgi:hypothetical protein
VRSYVSGCETCTCRKPAQHPRGPLQPLDVPEYPWQVVGVDLVGLLLLSDVNDMIITYVCHLTKQAHFFPCKSTITAKGLADMHVQHVFPLHRTPEKIILDRGPQFAAQMTKELYRLLGIEHAMSTSFQIYHQSSNVSCSFTKHKTKQKLLRVWQRKPWCSPAKLIGPDQPSSLATKSG